MPSTSVPPGTAICLEDCGWTAEGSERFNVAVDHREATGHQTAASLIDAPGDDTGQRVTQAFQTAAWALRQPGVVRQREDTDEA
jgi:hypothetical protein